MEQINQEIDNIFEKVKNERDFLGNIPQTEKILDTMNFDDKNAHDAYLAEYFDTKNDELSLNDRNFISAWSLLSYSERQNVIDSLEEENLYQLSEKLKGRLVIFEDLPEETDSLYQHIIEKFNLSTLATALKLTGDWSNFEAKEILGKLSICMKPEQYAKLIEEMEFLGAVQKTTVLDARKELCQAVKQFYNL